MKTTPDRIVVATVLVALVALALTADACTSSKSSAGGSGGGDGSSSSTTSVTSSTSSTSTTSAGSSGGGDGGVLGGTPIQWADDWVAGFYGTPSYQGVNRYDNTNTAGAPTGYYTEWRGDSGVTLFASVSDCSSFSDALLLRAYGWIPPASDVRSHADDYYWAIRNGDGFTEITDGNDIQVGDVIALLYPPGSSDTGHVAWIDVAPQAFSGTPQETGLSQLVVTVIDSTDGFHDGPTGPTTQADDRYLGPASGSANADGGVLCTSDVECVAAYGANAICNTTQLVGESVCSYTGVGRGRMRLYVDATGTIQGHTWSPNEASTYYPRPSPLPTVGATFTGEDIVVGRYKGP